MLRVARFLLSIGLGMSLTAFSAQAQHVPSSDNGPPPAVTADIVVPPYNLTLSSDGEVLSTAPCPPNALGRITNEVQNHSDIPLSLNWPAANIVLGKQRALPKNGKASAQLPVSATTFRLSTGSIYLGQYSQDSLNASTYEPDINKCPELNLVSYPDLSSRMVFDSMRETGVVRLELEFVSRPDRERNAIILKVATETIENLRVGIEYTALPSGNVQLSDDKFAKNNVDLNTLARYLKTEGDKFSKASGESQGGKSSKAFGEGFVFQKYWFLNVGPERPEASLTLPWAGPQQALEYRAARVFAIDSDGHIAASGMVAVWVPSPRRS
jgi:hypothetical protein